MSATIITYEDRAPNVRREGYEPIVDFAPGEVYQQVNIGSRYAVEALAKLFKYRDASVFEHYGPTYALASELTDRETFDPGSVAVFVHQDETGTELASVFVREQKELEP